VTPEDVKFLVVHCSATPATQAVTVKDIDRWHREKGWRMVGYHYVITREGEVQKGRPTWMAGAHALGVNGTSLGICMAGGANEKGKSQNNFTDDQFAALGELLINLQAEHPNVEVIGHRDVPNNATDCPGFDVRRWAKETGVVAS
jgi:N-acetylmuramoyl-L-alanine amidase